MSGEPPHHGSMIHYGEDPFATPSDAREPARRFRGRLASPVTVWTAYDDGGDPAGITVSSIMVDDGTPPLVVGLIDPLSLFWSALAHSRTFVVHVLDRDNRRVADQLAGRYPGPDARFEDVELSVSDWGPVLAAVETRAYCTFAGFVEAGDALIVNGTIDQVDVAESLDPLVYFRGAYREVRPKHPDTSSGL